MASSNRHWPSMFKSKPCNTTHHHQWQHDVNPSLLSSGNCTRTLYTPGSGCEERTPEPKPRWNPRPEQIKILESIFNSGMVNPPRDEIRKIRAQLQEYGQVGDANVFYWFQNRKSRSKHKQRQIHNGKSSHQHPQPTTTAPPPSATTLAAAAPPPSSSSSSSDKSSPNNSSDKSVSVGPITVIDLLNSPTASVNQPFFHANSNEFLPENFFFHAGAAAPSPPPAASATHGFYFPDVSSNVADQNNCPSNFLLSELMLMGHDCPNSKKDEDEKMKFHLNSYASSSAPNPNCHPIVPPTFSVPSISQFLQGADVGEPGPTRSTVFINDVCFEIGYGPFSVREAFGDDVVLIHSSGNPVLTNDWGVTLQPLQHGGFYYLSRPFAAPSPVDRTIDLI